MIDRPTLRIEPASPLAAIPKPRPVIDAAGIVARYYTQSDGTPIVTERWVRQRIPGKFRPSYSVVYWYVDEVERFIASTREKSA